jgi:hypothetical protein
MMDTVIGILLATVFGFLAICIFVGAVVGLIREVRRYR